MKGVVLAGGLGTRFHPVTKVVNKHLLDVFDEPMVFYPIRTLARAGITEVVVVSGDDLDQFKRLLDGGSDLGVDVSYAYQEGSGGIADALASEHFKRVHNRRVHPHDCPFAWPGLGARSQRKTVRADTTC